MVLATTITLSLRAVETARSAAASAAEVGQATQMLKGLIDTPTQSEGFLIGRTPTFLWSVATTKSAAAPGSPCASICARTASLVATRSGRHYRLSTAEICPPERTP